MKQITTLILLLISFGSIGQSFSCSDESLTMDAEMETYTSAQIDMDNLLGGDLFLEWEVIENSFNPNWDIALCDYTNCYTGIPASGVMTPVPAGMKGFLKITLNPFSIQDSGEVKFRVYDAKSSLEDTVMFKVRVINTTSVKEVNKNELTIYPNPSNGDFFIKSTARSVGKLYNVLGGELRTISIIEGLNPIEISDLPSGFYILKVQDQTFRLRFD